MKPVCGELLISLKALGQPYPEKRPPIDKVLVNARVLPSDRPYARDYSEARQAGRPRRMAAESVALKHQLLIMERRRHRVPILTPWDRLVLPAQKLLDWVPGGGASLGYRAAGKPPDRRDHLAQHQSR